MRCTAVTPSRPFLPRATDPPRPAHLPQRRTAARARRAPPSVVQFTVPVRARAHPCSLQLVQNRRTMRRTGQAVGCASFRAGFPREERGTRGTAGARVPRTRAGRRRRAAAGSTHAESLQRLPPQPIYAAAPQVNALRRAAASAPKLRLPELASQPTRAEWLLPPPFRERAEPLPRGHACSNSDA